MVYISRMKIVIDYGDNANPSAELVERMEANVVWAKEKLQPIIDEVNSSQGILILHTNNEYEVKETPLNVAYKIDQLLKPNFFPDF